MIILRWSGWLCSLIVLILALPVLLRLEPAVTQVNPVMIGAKTPHPNAARLFNDFILSKEGQERLRGMQRIPVRKDVEADPPRLFRGFKYVIENPEDYEDFNASVKQYLEIFKLR
jgi:ABC-type Fe3+ transport system substrate-binding protein